MAYLYTHSKTWRRIVDATSRSKGKMLLFAAACVGVPFYLGDQVMHQTSERAARGESELEKKLRSGRSLDAQILARAQRERLQVMLDEIRGGGGGDSEARYRAALDGQSLGTHSSGTTAGARAIRQQQQAPPRQQQTPQQQAAGAAAAAAAGAGSRKG